MCVLLVAAARYQERGGVSSARHFFGATRFPLAAAVRPINTMSSVQLQRNIVAGGSSGRRHRRIDVRVDDDERSKCESATFFAAAPQKRSAFACKRRARAKLVQQIRRATATVASAAAAAAAAATTSELGMLIMIESGRFARAPLLIEMRADERYERRVRQWRRRLDELTSSSPH